MTYHVAKVLSTKNKKAVLELVDAKNYSPLGGNVENFFHNEGDAILFKEKKLREAGLTAPKAGEPVVFVIVGY